jgi:hypothetical protein
MLDDGFAALEATDERVSEAELYRSRGLLLAHAGDRRSAEENLRRGIEVAQRQHGLLLELRTATALARLLAEQNRADEAHILVAHVTARFDQGRATPIVHGAIALMDALDSAAR